MIRILFFLALGMLVGGILLPIIGPPGAGVWAFPVGLTLAILAGTFVLIAKSVRGTGPADPRSVQAAQAAGRTGMARIDTLTQTGTRINDQPVCELEVTVQPTNGAAYRTVVRRIVPVTSIPAFQPGQLHAVVILADGKPDIALLDGTAASSTTGMTGGMPIPPAEQAGPVLRPEPGGLRRDGSGRRPIIGTGKRGRPIRFVVYLLVFLAAAAAVLLPYRDAVTQTIGAISQGRLHADMREPESLEQAMHALEESIGHEGLVDVLVYSDYVIVDAPISIGARETDSWMYRRGEVQHTGAATIQPELESEQFSARDVEWGALWPAVQQAGETTDIGTLDDVSLSVGRATDEDIDSETFVQPVGPVEVRFTISDAYHSVSFRMDADGGGLEKVGED